MPDSDYAEPEPCDCCGLSPTRFYDGFWCGRCWDVDCPRKPVIAADLTYARLHGRTTASLANWDHDQPPHPGQHVTVADGGSERLPAAIEQVDGDEIRLRLL